MDYLDILRNLTVNSILLHNGSGIDPNITVQSAWKLSSGVEKVETLDDLFRKSDAVTVHVIWHPSALEHDALDALEIEEL